MKRDVAASVTRAEAFLGAAQEPDGFWRDYRLVPGPSEAWITAVVGCALAAAPTRPAHRPRLERAVGALAEVHLGGGWGYNRYTSADADSTAWCVRFLCAMRPASRAAMWQPLAAFIDAGGRAHTMVLAAAGSWATAHADVTPVVGLALIAAGAPADLVRRVRGGVLRSRNGPDWPSFWWSTDLYATARALEFLEASGGVPSEVAAARHGLKLSPGTLDASPFELAQAIRIALALRDGDDAVTLAELLLAAQDDDGGWRASAMLALPSHEHGREPGRDVPFFPDEQRMMTTAMAIAALKRLALTWSSS